MIVSGIVILLSIIGLSFMAHNIPPNTHLWIKKDIRNYIENNEKKLISLEILEVSDLVEMYSPFENIIGLHWVLMNISKKSNYGKIKPEYEKDFLRVEEFINDIDPIIVTNYYNSDIKEPNRQGVVCKYRLNGVLEENVFYYENNNSKIGHDFKTVKKVYATLLKTYFEVRRDNMRTVYNE